MPYFHVTLATWIGEIRNVLLNKRIRIVYLSYVRSMFDSAVRKWGVNYFKDNAKKQRCGFGRNVENFVDGQEAQRGSSEHCRIGRQLLEHSASGSCNSLDM